MMVGRTRRLGAPALSAMILGAMTAASGVCAAGDGPLPRVLVFSKTEGFRHSSQIDAGHAMIADLAAEHGFIVESSEDDALFTERTLLLYDAIVFLNTTGDILDDDQQAAFENWIASGRGFVGIHSATDTEYGWPFYGQLIGAWFQNHPSVQAATVVNEAPDDPSTMHLDATFEHNDEWYNFQSNPADLDGTQVLLTVDESTYNGGSMGAVHPVAWKREYAGGRAWYTAMGHTTSTYSMEWFRLHVRGGIEYAIGEVDPGPAADLNDDGAVDASDLAVLLAAWGPCDGLCPADLDGSGSVDAGDLAALLAAWTG